MNFECPQSIFVIGGDKDHGPIRANQFQHFKSIQLGHLNVEKDQVGLQFGYRFHGFESIGAFRDNFNFRMTRQEFQQHLAREFLIVDDYGPDFLVAVIHRLLIPGCQLVVPATEVSLKMSSRTTRRPHWHRPHSAHGDVAARYPVPGRS